jgi:hypothetical protein
MTLGPFALAHDRILEGRKKIADVVIWVDIRPEHSSESVQQPRQEP